ncbi:MAG: LPS-assembly protein LptD, partial [Bacteroidetes bacterium]|nr:LPS-assembly protein LptD [Bacteroidota bacterium]
MHADTLKKDSLHAGISNEIKSKVHYTADDTIEFDISNEKVYLYKKAQVNYENIELKAAFISVDWNSKNVFSSGLRDSSGKIYDKPVFKDGDDEFKADTMRYNFDTKKGKVYNVTTQQGEGFIHGKIVKKEEESSYISHGRYTTCDLDTPHYYIAANKLKVIPNNKIITGPAYLVIADVPTPAAIPFGLFPNTKGRSSGILFPAYGESNSLGFFFKNGGYYFGISDHVDLSLTGDIYTLGSWAVRASSRYSNRYHYNGNLSFLYSIIKVSEKDLPDYSRSKEFFINWSHQQDAKARPNGI